MGLIDTTSSIKKAQKPVQKFPDLPKSGSSGHDLSKPEVPMVSMHRGEAARVYGDYNTLDEMESNSSALAKIEMWIAKAVGTSLVRKYPGRQWGVQVNAEGGLMIISCGSLSTEKGYHIKINGENLNGLEARAVRAAGEILERYGVSRNRINPDGEIESLDRDWQDKVISADAYTKETL